ncbi:patatin-like phospholipase domain-containing protein 3 [Platysternon megacephalum]|uniref:Patatin-like phospholipase domain-containing protein 3 n=1 Tax=Platysternon megacephalum TaxID=55544 RepID=A0A4D9ECM9_9SAUR|nr:patatin-like phospholipase domain-containing protein 3 [Platysternon megacephalum]
MPVPRTLSVDCVSSSTVFIHLLEQESQRLEDHEPTSRANVMSIVDDKIGLREVFIYGDETMKRKQND